MNPADPTPLAEPIPREIDIALDEIDGLQQRHRDEARYVAMVALVDLLYASLVWTRWREGGLSDSSEFMFLAICFAGMTLAALGGWLSTRRRLSGLRSDVDRLLRESDA